MYWWPIIAIIVAGTPFYIYLISRCWTAGKLSIYERKMKKEKPHGEEEQEGRK